MRLVPALLCVCTLACGAIDKLKNIGGDDDDDKDVPTTQFACRFDVRAISCETPTGSEWTPSCLTVKTEAACTEATQPTTEILGGCEFHLEYRAVQAQAGVCAGVVQQEDVAAPTGEPCASHEGCASGFCQPRYYCTVACKTSADCASEFSNGCCVSEGSLGYCIKQKDCQALCPDGATPQGLPTTCTCAPGFRLSSDGSQCVRAG